MNPTNKIKRAVTEHMLADGPVLLTFFVRPSTVPEMYSEDETLTLRFGHNLVPDIPDLEVSDDAISGTLEFRGEPFRCVISWDAVFAIVSEMDHAQMVWPQAVKPEPKDPERPMLKLV